MSQTNSTGAADRTELMVDDLAKSTLKIGDMLTRILDDTERNICNVPIRINGYVIPYFDMLGKVVPYYRLRLFDYEPKYKQIKNTANHVYFPKNFMEVFTKANHKIVILTEGEKKAALCCKLGIPAVAFGGIESWQNRIMLLPKESEITPYALNKNLISAKLPTSNIDESMMSSLAMGLQDLMDFGLQHGTTFLICYDTDTRLGVKPQVQRAAAKLGYELRFKGFNISKIKQIILPWVPDLDKTSLDDFLLHKDHGPKAFVDLIQKAMDNPTAFPRHPNIREHVAKQLNKPRLDRKQLQNLSLSLITELDARGRRMYSKSESQMYYFDGDSRHLMTVDINSPNKENLHETPFGKMVYRDYSISPAADRGIMGWFGAQFAGEDPVESVEPHRVVSRSREGEDAVRYQVNDGQYIKVTGDPEKPFTLVPNGSDNVLFAGEQVADLDPDELLVELAKRQLEVKDGSVPKMWWGEVLKEVRLKNQNEQATIAALLYYISPWLYRWRGMQLPVELIIGESGSGKSTLMDVRLSILTGSAHLRNAPSDLRDWHASVANTGGLHVTDNVNLVDKQLRQRLSDEICRIITEPDPHVEMRKLYSNAELMRVRVDSVFAFTAITQPFQNADLLQRAILLELDKSISDKTSAETKDPDVGFLFDSFWRDRQLARFGGRTGWISHHLHILHLFFVAVKTKWNNKYQAKHRLINLEQSLVIMAEIFGMESDWIPTYLAGATNSVIGKSDWALEGLLEFADLHRIKDARSREPERFSASDIAKWAAEQEDYAKCYQLTESRSLGRYMQTHKHNMQMIAGIIEKGSKNNKTMYCCVPIKNILPKDPREARVGDK